jgi:hypothetical protein
MGKWIKKIIAQKISESENMISMDDSHIPLEDLADMVDGCLNPQKREAYIHHLDNCQDCYDLLNEILTDLSNKSSHIKKPAKKFSKPFFTMAASLFFLIIISGALIFNHIRSPYTLTASVNVDDSISQILLETNSLTWTENNRVKRFAAILKSKNVKIKSFDKVVLTSPYTQSKSLFKTSEILKIRVQDNIAYIEIISQ